MTYESKASLVSRRRANEAARQGAGVIRMVFVHPRYLCTTTWTVQAVADRLAWAACITFSGGISEIHCSSKHDEHRVLSGWWREAAGGEVLDQHQACVLHSPKYRIPMV